MLLPEDMADLSNFELLHLLFPREMFENEVVWLLGSYMAWVYEEVVVKGRVVTDGHARGYMRYCYYQSLKTKMPEIGHINDVTNLQNIVFDNG